MSPEKAGTLFPSSGSGSHSVDETVGGAVAMEQLLQEPS